jgi:hypothetical protein
MKTRFIAGLISVCLVLGVFAGCGKTADTETYAEADDVGVKAERIETTLAEAPVDRWEYADLISEEDWVKALTLNKIDTAVGEYYCSPVDLMGELYIANSNSGHFIRINPDADSAVYPKKFAFPKIEITLSVSQISAANNMPKFNKPDYIFGENYEENKQDIPQEMIDAVIELTGKNAMLMREFNVDEYNINIKLENAEYCNIDIGIDESINDFSEMWYAEPTVTLDTKNIGFSKISIDTSRMSIDIKDSDSIMSYCSATIKNAERVTASPYQIKGGGINIQANNVETFSFLPNGCMNAEFIAYAANIMNARVITDELSENPSENIKASLTLEEISARPNLKLYEFENFYFKLGDEDNSTWDIAVRGGYLVESSATFAFTTNETGTVSLGQVYSKEICKAILKPDRVMTINKDMFYEFIQNCDPTKTYLWDDTTDRAAEVS